VISLSRAASATAGRHGYAWIAACSADLLNRFDVALA